MKWQRLLLALTFLVTPVAAKEKPQWTTFVFQGENDALAAAGRSDEHYTNGVRFFGLRHPDYSRPWVDGFAKWYCRWACGRAARTDDRFTAGNSVGFAFGQLIYTPDDISIPELIVDDRLYAGWLYGALLLQITTNAATRQHAFELQLGVVGPESGAEWSQSRIHELIDDEPPRGWDNQLPTELGINFIYRYQRCFGLEASGRHFDVVPHAGGALGTVMVMANAGATVRAGWNITGFPQTEIPTTLVPMGRPKWELYVFAGAEGRAVAHNVFLDGTVFHDSHSVGREDFVYDLRAGFSLRFKSFRFHYALVRRSREFSPPRGSHDGRHNFGSFTLGIERSF